MVHLLIQLIFYATGYLRFRSSSIICALVASLVKYPLGFRRITAFACSLSEQTVTNMIFTRELSFLIFSARKSPSSLGGLISQRRTSQPLFLAYVNADSAVRKVCTFAWGSAIATFSFKDCSIIGVLSTHMTVKIISTFHEYTQPIIFISNFALQRCYTKSGRSFCRFSCI